MNTDERSLRAGVKTFFVVPELSLFPEEHLKSYFMKGFETYFLDDDPYCPLEVKIDILFSLFSEVFLFFNIDRVVRGIDWPVYIEKLQKKYRERATIGVMFCKRNSMEEIRNLERLYLYDIGIIGGCIPIEYQKTKNLNLFLNVLIANRAMGQRKHLRAICDDANKMNLRFNGIQYQSNLRDISISHFSCVFVGNAPEIPLHEKIFDIQLNLRGILFRVNGVFCLKRTLVEDLIHVFVFRTSEDKEGLNPEQMLKINEIIFNSFQTEMCAFLKNEFDANRAALVKEKNGKPELVFCADNNSREYKIAENNVLNMDVNKLLEAVP